MNHNNNCENQQDCIKCNKWGDCWSNGNDPAINPLLLLEINKYSGNVGVNKNYQYVYKSDPINCNNTNDGVLLLIRWEVEYRIKHNSNPNRLTTKAIDIIKITNWYNNKYYATLQVEEVTTYLEGFNLL